MISDLHTHSTFSDGALRPVDLVAALSRAGIECISLTDHDTVAGLAQTRKACETAGIRFVPGVEISAQINGEEVHLLGYGFNPQSESLLKFLNIQGERRLTRITEFQRRLVEAGVPISAVDFDGESRSTVGRPHLANAIIAAGAARSIREAFDTYLMPGTATFVPRILPSASESIEKIHASAGIVSLAHPGDYISNQTVLGLIGIGLDAIEVKHPAHDQRLSDYYTDLAVRHNLFCTGGSDYHGWRSGEEENIGRFSMDWELPPNILM